MKSLAGAILSQRSEIEEFFIEALNEVRRSYSLSGCASGQWVCAGEDHIVGFHSLISSLQSVL
jgi:hypothetical protein